MTEIVDRVESIWQCNAGEELAPTPPPPDNNPPGLPAVALLAWLSPSFPVGSFAFSHGLEWAVEAGDVIDLATLSAWVGALVEQGSVYNDAVLLGVGWRAMHNGDMAALDKTNQLAVALAGSRERRLETVAQGNAFLNTALAAWPAPIVETTRAYVPGDIAYPVAVAMVSAAHQISLAATLEAYCLSVVQNLISAAIRLNAVGQTDGQRAVAALLPMTQVLALKARSTTIDDVGGAVFRSDIAALQHETQYTRLFRS